jgi:hypothetical protein
MDEELLVSLLVDHSSLRNKCVVNNALPAEKDFWHHLPF